MFRFVSKSLAYLLSFSFIGLFVVLLIESILFPIYTGGSSSEVYIPDVRDKYLTQARDILYNSGLEVIEIEIPWSPGSVPGTVVGINPKPPTKVKKGRIVEISIAGSEKSIIMPSLINFSVRNALIEIDRLNLREDTIKYEYSSTVPKGVVIDQIPQKNLTITSGHPVSIIVSDGPIPGIITVPILDTGNIHLERAKSMISQSTLEVGEISYMIVPDFMPNMVISQSAYGGMEIDVPIKIDLEVTHDGEVPNLIGLTVNDASIVFDSSPFIMGEIEYVDSDLPSGLIFKQLPEANISLTSFEPIKIYISK